MTGLTFDTLTAFEDAHTSGAYPKRPLVLVHGAGVTVWDDAGNPYIDATSGQGVALLGHCHPAVTAAIAEQAQTLITSPEIFYNDRRAELYALLSDILPGDINRFFLCNSGAEAVEAALKAAKLFTGRDEIIATKRSFHGRTLGALSLTWNPKYRAPFQSWTIDQVTHIAYNNLDAARAAISQNTAAIIVEAVQGEGGVHPADAGYLEGLRDLCDEYDVLLIIDEIQTGLGRTGQWFGFQHADVQPDIVALGKGIAGGVPMGAVCWRESLGTLPTGSHGSTFGGNPLACAAAIATLTTLRDENIPASVNILGTWLHERLVALGHPQIREVRGLGLMMGVELRGRVTPVLKNLQEHGVLALPAGLNVLRLLP
ncbi:MAG: aspartate aminotransferase family protein, partial [Chloroflexi bacterium]